MPNPPEAQCADALLLLTGLGTETCRRDLDAERIVDGRRGDRWVARKGRAIDADRDRQGRDDAGRGSGQVASSRPAASSRARVT